MKKRKNFIFILLMSIFGFISANLAFAGYNDGRWYFSADYSPDPIVIVKNVERIISLGEMIAFQYSDEKIKKISLEGIAEDGSAIIMVKECFQHEINHGQIQSFWTERLSFGKSFKVAGSLEFSAPEKRKKSSSVQITFASRRGSELETTKYVFDIALLE